MSLIIPGTFQHILRVMNTNIDGKRNIMFAMTAIKGCGRRYANLVLKKVRPLIFCADVLENFRKCLVKYYYLLLTIVPKWSDL